MNVQNKKPIIIFSVDQSNVGGLTNEGSREYVRDTLKNLGISFKEVEGSYKGSYEVSFVVINTLANFSVVKKLAEAHSQESILIRNSLGYAELFFLKTKDVVKLGQFEQVTKQYALSKDAWTFDYENDQYYAIV